LYIPPTLGFDPNLPALNVNLPSTQIPLASLPVNETVSISLGSVAMPLNNVYGVAFDIYFDPAFVNTASITTNYLNSIFGTDGVNFTKIEDRSGLSSGRFSIGITRFNTTGINATGGDVLKITLPLKTGSPGGLFKVTVLPQGCNSPTGVELSITGSEDSLIVGSLQACTTNTWVGNISTAWENAANWSCGTVPISTSVVSIPSGRPFALVIKSMATCKSLTSATGSIIKIDPGYKLTIVGPQ
jgi:hypothetical protein